ncbi:DNA-directed RNA polymerase subunit omega [Candidatus Legionella polyplacis]|uniref:DNA-directed RNA polymerase subunit omega n=1 Tax=Candidatus Legionella polyplacis TaxID=2005262 RepID=UPI000C1F2CDA|nr:DNA-directed RNA polymerase subunit omega [Candidatus Legionella polyplacis]ATW02044.1 DNA-directed RNA polymerase subunit omega [Candidatus Legionella polyplacis]
MARVTIEDCLNFVSNRFELVMLATKRARNILINGEKPLVECKKDKITVVALKEIAFGLINKDILEKK